jgi:hypothetical protein
MAVNFPNTPALNEEFSAGDRTWLWNGTYWEAISTTIGYTGSAGEGFTGSQGELGYTGSRGNDGTGVRIVGSVSTASLLPDPYTGDLGDGYVVDDTGSLYVWTGSVWNNVGQIVGPAGPTGFTGSRGYDGSIGFTGSQGTEGVIGFTGSAGIDGAFAALGYTGSQGDVGYTGSKGDLGYTGLQGDTGFTGSQGDTGFTGSRGIDGAFAALGYTGSAGYTGSQGDSGVQTKTVSYNDVLVTFLGLKRWWINTNYTIRRILAYVTVPSVGANIIVGINKNGALDRTITIPATTAYVIIEPSGFTVSTGDYITVDILQIGSATAGEDLTVIFEYW